jgi:hypothetical protein
MRNSDVSVSCIPPRHSFMKRARGSHLIIFTCLLHGGACSLMFRFRYFHGVCENGVCLVACRDANTTFIVNVRVVQLLEVSTELTSHGCFHSTEASSIVSESSLARAVLYDDLACQCLIILSPDAAVIVTVAHSYCAFCNCWATASAATGNTMTSS